MRNHLLPLALWLVPFQGVSEVCACGLQDPDPAQPSSSDSHLEELARGIEAQVAEIRGLEFKRPVEVHFASKKTFVEYYHAMEDSMGGAELADKERQMAVLLGLIPSGLNLGALQEELLAGQVGGFYDPASDAFYVMEGLDDDLIRIIMAHELTHALDDQYYDLAAKDLELKENNDALLAHHAVIEGSAQVVMTRWIFKNLSTLDRKALLKYQEQMDVQAMLSAPRMVWKPLLALYQQGQAFLNRKEQLSMFAKADIADLDRAFKQLPVSTEQILHPQKYWSDKALDLPHRVEQDLAGLPEGWQAQHSAVLGELFLGLLTAPPEGDLSAMSLMTLKYTDDGSAGWGGDRVQILAQGDARVLVLDTYWDSDADAAEFAKALDQREVEDDPLPGRVMSFVEFQEDSRWVRLVAWSATPREVAAEVAASIPASASRSGKITGSRAVEPRPSAK